MINTMTPPVLWPELQRVWRRLREIRADRRMRRTKHLAVDHLSDRMLRDIGLHELGPRSPYHPPHIWL